MGPVYRWLEHTSEAELLIEDETPGGVLTEALVALGELLGDGGGEPVTHEVNVGSEDMPGLLVEWLNELVYLAETDGFIPERVVRMHLADAQVRAAIGGRRCAPQSLVKGVTYHRLKMEETGEGWQARVVFDV